MPTRTKSAAPTDTTSLRDEALSSESDLGVESLSAAAQALTQATQQSAQTLSNAAQALTQATQQLTVTAAQLSRMAQGRAEDRGAGEMITAAGVQINVWEDDPFSEASPTPNPARAQPIAVGVPKITAPLLRAAIVAQQPAPSKYAPGTANFRYWTAAEALARGIAYWTALLPKGTRWSTRNPVLQVTLDAGETLNAFYSRVAGLRFFRDTVRNVAIFAGESPDVVCHELGHAVLDAVRPELFNAASIEAAAFHESFGDMSSILVSLQLPTLRQKALQETQGRLNVNSRLSRVAEQLGWGIRQISPEAVDADCLRNAANRFFYQPPEGLPPEAPAVRLSSEPHSFSRVFTGAFLDALARMLTAAGAATDANLIMVARDMGRLLVDGVRTAAVVPTYYSQVAAAMIQADRVRNSGRYRKALADAFLRRGILSPGSVAGLANAPVPKMQAATASAARAMAAAGAFEGGGFVGSGFGGGGFAEETPNDDQLLVYDDGNADDAYLRGFDETPELPERPLSLELDLGAPLFVHAPAQQERFAAAPAKADAGSLPTPDADYAARVFVEDLLRLGRIELGQATGVAPELSSPTEEKTHTLVSTPGGLLLKRLHFDCGLHRHG